MENNHKIKFDVLDFKMSIILMINMNFFFSLLQWFWNNYMFNMHFIKIFKIASKKIAYILIYQTFNVK
jgi:hypothetical protein